MASLTNLCKQALEKECLPEISDLIEKWKDEIPRFSSTEEEIEDEMNRLIDAKAYMLVNNRLGKSGNVELGNERYFFDRDKACLEAVGVWCGLSEYDKARADIYVTGPDGFFFLPQLEENRRRYGGVVVPNGDELLHLVFVSEPVETDYEGRPVFEVLAVPADGTDARRMPCYKVLFEITNPEPAAGEDYCDWGNPLCWESMSYTYDLCTGKRS